MKIELLPKWVIPDTSPFSYDTEGVTTLESIARTRAKMNELIEHYNEFVDACNEKITGFHGETLEELKVFESALRQEFQDFIDVVDLKYSAEIGKELEEAKRTIKNEAETFLDKLSLSIVTQETIENSYVTPEMFGAKGDGETDDTSAFEEMLVYGTSILIPNKRYRITRKLFLNPNTYIRGCGKDSVIVCYSGEDLLMISGYCHVENLTVEVQSELSGAIFKINEESLGSFRAKDAALATVIDKIWVDVKVAVDPQVSCFEVSNNNGDGFFDVSISNIHFYGEPSRSFGYFFKSFVKGDAWITGVTISDCKIYGCRWGIFLNDSDQDFFSSGVGGCGNLVVRRVQHQKTKTNCKAFLFKKTGGKVSLIDCTPWDWNVIGDADTKYAYWLPESAYKTFKTGNVLYINDLNYHSITLFAMVKEDGTPKGLGYSNLDYLYFLGCEQIPFTITPKIMGIAGKSLSVPPKTMLIYKNTKTNPLTVHFDIFSENILSHVMVSVGTSSVTKVTVDKDIGSYIRIGYKFTDTHVYLYLIFKGDYKNSTGFVRSWELSNSLTAFGSDNTYTDYNHTINPWEIKDEPLFAETKADDITTVPMTDVVIDYFAPVVKSSSGSSYRIIVDDYGNLSTGNNTTTNPQTLVSANGTRYKLVVADDGTLTTEKVTSTPKQYSKGYPNA